jgi:DNA-directed RNA polymerase subunit K/omega
LENLGKIDSKFRFVILVSKRAKQLLKGAKVKIRGKTKNPIRLAQLELQEGVIDYEILQQKKDETVETEDAIFSGEESAGSADEEEEEEVIDKAADNDDEEPEEEEEDVEEEYDEDSDDEEKEED